jgi:hypothetical protein
MDQKTRFCRALSLAALLLFSGCSSSDEETAGDTVAAPAASSSASGNDGIKDSWMYAVVADTGVLSSFEQGQSGEGWLAFFNNNLEAARSGFESSCTPSAAPLKSRAAAGYACVGLARTHLELAHFFAEAAEVGRVTLRQFYLHRKTHPEEVLPSLHQAYFSGVTLLQSGEREEGVALLNSYAGLKTADPMLAALAKRIVAGLDGSDPLVMRIWGGGSDTVSGSDFSALPASTMAVAYRARLNLMAAVAAGDFAAATALIRPIPTFDADLKEELEQRDGASQVAPVLFHYDSSFLSAMSRLHALRALHAVGTAEDLAVLRVDAERLLGQDSAAPDSAPGLPEGLALVLFSTTPSPSDLVATLAGSASSAPILDRLASEYPALNTEPTTTLADLDPFIDMSNQVRGVLAELIKSAAPHGANMDADMGLSERFRGALLLERVRQFQERFAVRLEFEMAADAASAGIAARSLLELVLDKNPSPPNGQLKRARISYRNDPTLLVALARAQLDTRQSYEANDYIRPLSQLYAELVPVREALAALDSAWNPARRGSVR